jgi:hypothetical protein
MSEHLDKVAEAIRDSKRLAEELYQLSQQQDDKLEELRGALLIVQSFDKSHEIVRILNQLERIHELRRMQEIGAFSLRVRTQMEISWRALP